MHTYFYTYRISQNRKILDMYIKIVMIRLDKQILSNSFFAVLGPDMMLYDDFTNEDLGNVIMDADNDTTTQLDTGSDLAEFRSIRPKEITRGRRRRKRKRDRNQMVLSRRRPGKI